MQRLDATSWGRVKPLLDQALTLAPQDRASFLDQACTDDRALRVAVEQLLNELKQFDQSTFMESPMADRFEALLADVFGPDAAVAEPLEIGPYRTMRTLGYGGMGTVFLAERVDGQFEDQVALKLIKQGLHSQEGLRRFLTERQILAQLRHPNIAHLYDGGIIDDGRPYFVMEYVEGQSITDYCAARQLSIKGRLGLFLQVCAALQYAHQNLVVHRDVKPPNILVTDAGQVKLLDFGIAKLLRPEAEDTMTGTVSGALTPAYAAPEQVKGGLITTATDVYAVGVLLYELLSGHRPYQVQGASIEEWVQVICETEPVRPSLVVGQQNADADIEAASALGLQRTLSGDLDTIVLKALRKEPQRRYGSVEALAGDLERYLSNMPILARRDTPGYRLGKFVRRHRVGVGFAVLLMLLVSGFTWRTMVEQRRAAVAAAQANEVSGFLVDLFTMSDPHSTEPVRGDSTEVRVFLERGASEIEKLSGQGEVQSMLRGVLGRVYRGLGQYEQAEVFFREALAQRRVLYGDESVEVAQSMSDLGHLLTLWSGERAAEAEGNVYEEAEGLLREALGMHRALLGAEHVDVAETLNRLAATLRAQGKYADAETMFEETLAMRRKLLGEEHLDVVASRNNLAQILYDQGKSAEAETEHREVLALRRKLLGEEHPQVAMSFSNLALALYGQGKYGEAETMFREALSLRRKLLGEEHPLVATSLNNLAAIVQIQGKYAEAETGHREVLALRRKLLGEEHPQVAVSLNNLALSLYGQGKYGEAETVNREALALRRKLLGEEHPLVAISINNLALALHDQGKYAEAERRHREALALYRKLLGDEHPEVALSLNNLGMVLLDRGKHGEAEAVNREALALRRKLLGEEHPQVATSLNSLGRVLHAQGKYDEAEPMLREALAMRKKLLGEEHQRVAITQGYLGTLLVDRGAYAEAEPMLLASIETLKQAIGIANRQTQRYIESIITLYTAWEKPEEADRYRAMRTEEGS